jgi:UDP-N-acetylglucosamine--N-acetylmuramyl-(pentapeptide) pyrophosphoryl-undecaprenol N-acetylglucosamine transferase
VRIALAAGGTGGHMFPAQSLAEEAKARGWQVMLLTDKRGLRFAEGFPRDEDVILKAASPSAKGAFAKLAAVFAILGGIRQARRALKSFGADAVIGFGGYPSAPSMMAAQRLKLPTGLHEQNAVLGRANRLSAKKAGFLAHGFPILMKKPSGLRHLTETGNPVRQAVLEAARTAFEEPGEGPLRVLIFGGSQGARLFARVFAPALAELPEELRTRLDVTHQAHDDDRDELAGLYKGAGIQAELAPFFADLPRRIAESHLVIARSGASSVAELSVIGRPSLLVPLKIAMDDHQRINAQVLTEAGAADLILEDDLTAESAARALLTLLSDTSRLTAMAAAAKGRMAENAAGDLADLTEALVAGKL